MKHSFKRAGISPAQKAARIKNFSIFRLRGVLATLRNIKHLHADIPDVIADIQTASDFIFTALHNIKEKN